MGFLNEQTREGGVVEIGYVLHPDFWNRGYMTEAVGAVIRELFRMGASAVRAGHFEENASSRRVMEKNGMTPIPFSEEQLSAVREGMRMVVAGDGRVRGTGWRAGDGVGVSVSGKTGTAEVGVGANRRKNVWFMAYAPSEAPVAAVALVVENGETGGGTAAPKVCEILKAFFGGAGS